jgi:hypothetical protein
MAVVDRVRDHQDYDINLAVAMLERDPAFKRLDVPKSHFQLAASGSSEQDRNAIPRTAVAGDRERHLRSPGSSARKSPAEPFSEPEMSRIPGRVTIGVRLQRNAQAHRCCGTCSLIDREFRELSALDPAELGVGHIGGRAGRPLADRRVKAASEEFGTEGTPDALCDATPVECGFVPRRHASHHARRDLRPTYCWSPQTHRTVRSPGGSSAVPLKTGAGVWR